MGDRGKYQVHGFGFTVQRLKIKRLWGKKKVHGFGFKCCPGRF
jgi:hypothetical protein